MVCSSCSMGLSWQASSAHCWGPAPCPRPRGAPLSHCHGPGRGRGGVERGGARGKLKCACRGQKGEWRTPCEFLPRTVSRTEVTMTTDSTPCHYCNAPKSTTHIRHFHFHTSSPSQVQTHLRCSETIYAHGIYVCNSALVSVRMNFWTWKECCRFQTQHH